MFELLEILENFYIHINKIENFESSYPVTKAHVIYDILNCIENICKNKYNSKTKMRYGYTNKNRVNLYSKYDNYLEKYNSIYKKYFTFKDYINDYERKDKNKLFSMKVDYKRLEKDSTYETYKFIDLSKFNTLDRFYPDEPAKNLSRNKFLTFNLIHM